MQTGTEKKLWDDIMSQKRVESALNKWRERVTQNAAKDSAHESSQSEENEEKENEEKKKEEKDSSHESKQRTLYLKNTPFRMVLHKVNKMKRMYSFADDNKHDSRDGDDNTAFALMWVPSNEPDGMNDNEFKEFIDAMRESYFVRKLNKDSVYISGPSYEQEKNSDEVWYPEIYTLFQLKT